MTRKRIPLHPGDFIKSVYIEEGGLTAAGIAEAIGVNKGTFSRLLRGHNDVSPAMALKLSAVLGRTPESWLNLQQAHSLAKAEAELKSSRWSPVRHLVGGKLRPAKERAAA